MIAKFRLAHHQICPVLQGSCPLRGSIMLVWLASGVFIGLGSEASRLSINS